MPARPDLGRVSGLVHPSFIEAAKDVSHILTSLKVRHALIGGLAVGAYGYPRATKDVDFVVGDEAFEHHGPIVSFRSGIPLRIGSVIVDVLADSGVPSPYGTRSMGVPIVSLAVLTYLKIKAFRMQDQLDVVELLRHGCDQEEMAKRLTASQREGRFEKLVARAAGGGSGSPFRGGARGRRVGSSKSKDARGRDSHG